MWTCPTCGMDGNDDVESRCPGCGASRNAFPQFSGTAGSVTVRTGLVWGCKNLAELVGADDARFAERRQFEVFRKDGEWSVRAFARTRNATLLNGAELQPDGTPLKDGDVLCIASRRDASVTRARISVTMN